MEEIKLSPITRNLQSIDQNFHSKKRICDGIEKSIPGPTTENTQKLEADAASLDEKIKALAQCLKERLSLLSGQPN
ncbi:hypothetical protein TNIN_391811 [Trichonephila inaurata madagascariensis]|uniref:Uncharacterized protein n=1 Tax=Trichonephila inaurata madagascariensis TaxID=2747483 RepID=A0A8X6YLY1_9ARAC|nr:hypothetical protein TNIN_391811 [Trichonephila inaurata madagascariensis]